MGQRESENGAGGRGIIVTKKNNVAGFSPSWSEIFIKETFENTPIVSVKTAPSYDSSHDAVGFHIAYHSRTRFSTSSSN